MRFFPVLAVIMILSGCLSGGSSVKNATDDQKVQDDQFIKDYLAKEKAGSSNRTLNASSQATTNETANATASSTTLPATTTSSTTTSTTVKQTTTTSASTTTTTSTSTTTTVKCSESCYDIKLPSPRSCALGCCISPDTRCVYQSSINEGPKCRCR